MIRLHSTRSLVAVVMFCHFIAAFAALGMPPYFAQVLERSLKCEAGHLAGWLYVVPTAFTALSSPFWGKLADRMGKKPLLIRAQLGLAGSFLLAGFAQSPGVFFLALALQGTLGGTFSASNAYLSTLLSGPSLTRGLTAMQWSARAALVVAPVALGLCMGAGSPIHLYRYLALLPLLAALLIARIPEGAAPQKGDPRMASPASAESADKIIERAGSPETSPLVIYGLQFAFVFSTVLTFPYFISWVLQCNPSLPSGWAGLLFGLPNLVYLLSALPLVGWLGKKRNLSALAGAYLALAASLLGQAFAVSLWALGALRLVMGAAMTCGFIALHALVAGVVKTGNAGRAFGWFESSSKWGAVAGGALAGLVAQPLGFHSPFLIGGFTLSLAAALAAVLSLGRLRPAIAK
jgi:MFS family permease